VKTSRFYFDLPEELIAQRPPEKRGTCRLLSLNRTSQEIEHHFMPDFPSLIPADALVVFNDTRVRKVRLFAESKATGGKVEIFLLKHLPGNRWECMLSKAKKQKVGKEYLLPGRVEALIESQTEDNHRILKFSEPLSDAYLDKWGHIPLPPYIKRPDEKQDHLRYQTVFAKETGSAAAPTASLHFTPDILQELNNRGIESCFLTLHVGLGTFAPVRSENILDHKMHREEFHIEEKTARAIEKAKKEGRPVIAVGTTSLRALESAWDGRSLLRGWQSTDIFIYPGYEFSVVDGLFTNFHTPESTLLMLVSAFAGEDGIKKAYKEAIEHKYMFFSYGDSMLIQ